MYTPSIHIRLQKDTDHRGDVVVWLSFSGRPEWLAAIKYYYEQVSKNSEMEIRQIKRPKKGRPLPTILSIGEVDRLLRATENLKHVTILYTLYSTGMRLGEILGLRVSDLRR